MEILAFYAEREIIVLYISMLTTNCMRGGDKVLLFSNEHNSLLPTVSIYKTLNNVI